MIAELERTHSMSNKHGTNTEPHNWSNNQQRINNNRTAALERPLERPMPSLLFVQKKTI